MTKIIAGPPAEYAEHAAVRAAAEVLHLPCRVVPGKMGRKTRKLQLSSRDSGIKDYHFTLVPIEVHLDFQDLLASRRSVIFLDVSKLRDKEYEPVSPTVKPILDACAEWGWL